MGGGGKRTKWVVGQVRSITPAREKRNQKLSRRGELLLWKKTTKRTNCKKSTRSGLILLIHPCARRGPRGLHRRKKSSNTKNEKAGNLHRDIPSLRTFIREELKQQKGKGKKIEKGEMDMRGKETDGLSMAKKAFVAVDCEGALGLESGEKWHSQ